jgi:hypothetical protein
LTHIGGSAKALFAWFIEGAVPCGLLWQGVSMTGIIGTI